MKSGKKQRTLPKPIYTVSPDGAWGLSLNFSRLEWLRPGYGYAGFRIRAATCELQRNTGSTASFNTGKSVRLVSIADAAKIPHLGDDMADHWHWSITC